jgi:hypothetical protein
MYRSFDLFLAPCWFGFREGESRSEQEKKMCVKERERLRSILGKRVIMIDKSGEREGGIEIQKQERQKRKREKKTRERRGR